MRAGSNRKRASALALTNCWRLRTQDHSGPFNMACLAMRGSGSVNAVSRLHGAVSRRLFQPLYPRRPPQEVPVAYVTNGVHVATWECPRAAQLWSGACGEDRWLGELECVEKEMRKLSDSQLWEFRAQGRRSLVEFTRKRLVRQRAGEGAAPDELAEAGHVFDPDALTLGFARRFATYKRPTLLLHDPERLARLLTSRDRPVQLVLAGKAHPQDFGGQAMVKQWNDFIRRPDVRSRVVYLSDYDMLMTQHLAEGVDVWINTPRRPWEASGTSGMKLLVNGGLNLSELDGWWAEAYRPEVGWAIGDGREHGEDPAWDAAEAGQLYSLLEREVIPEFYTRDAQGIPRAWLARIRESMAELTPRFSANRVVREYTTEHYIPAAEAYRKRAAAGGKLGAELAAWSRTTAEHWPGLHFGTVSVEPRGGEYEFTAQVYLDSMPPDAVRVELYADARDGGDPFRQTMTRGDALVGSAGGYCFSARVPANRPASDYTARIVPFHPDARVPLEASEILWQR